MIWAPRRNPFKQHHGSKRGAISKTAEREFEREVKKLESLDEDTRKIQKDIRRLMESQAYQMRSENKLVHTIYNSSLSRDDPMLRFVTDQWFQSAQQLDLLSQELNNTAQKTVADPMKKFSAIFPSMQQVLKKREQALAELNKCQSRMDKYSERDRTGQNIVKLDQSRKALTTAKQEFDAQNGQLVDEIPRLYEGRIDYVQPSFQALIKSQLKYYTEAQKVYSLLASSLSPAESTPEYSDPFADTEGEEAEEERPEDAKLRQTLADIKALAITADD